MNLLITLQLHRFRRDRWQLLIWIAGIGLLGLFAASAVAQTYGNDAGREGIIRLAVANPAILMLRGLPEGTRLDAFVFFQIFTFLALMAGLMSTFLAVRHSRAEEETGRAELLSATPASRNLPTLATLVHGLLANMVLCLAVAAGFMAGAWILPGPSPQAPRSQPRASRFSGSPCSPRSSCAPGGAPTPSPRPPSSWPT
jgi:ABC-2 type transport system permease protein